MQFIYLGEATFYEERMNEFLSVAKSLEIKEICTAETETETNEDDEPSPSYPETSTSTDNSGEQTMRSTILKNQAPRDNIIRDKGEVVRVYGKYKCGQCDKEYGRSTHLHEHIRSKHEGVKYACDQCDYEATQYGNLMRHKKGQHNNSYSV